MAVEGRCFQSKEVSRDQLKDEGVGQGVISERKRERAVGAYQLSRPLPYMLPAGP